METEDKSEVARIGEEGVVMRAEISCVSCSRRYMSFHICQNTWNVQRENSNLWFGVIMMCHCWFIDCNKCSTRIWGVGSRRDCVCRNSGSVGILYFPFSFAVNLDVL